MGKSRKTLLKSLIDDWFGDRIYCDVIIQVEDMTYTSHRFMLSLVSKYFYKMFRNRLRENINRRVVISGPFGHSISSDTFSTVLNYVYTGTVLLSDKNVTVMLSASEYLVIFHLKDLCVQFLEQSISHRNWIEVFNLADKYCLENLSRACLESFLDVYEDLNFDNFDFQQILNTVKHNQHFQSNRSIALTRSILTWVKCKEDERKKHLDELLGHVNYSKLTTSFVENHLCTEPLLMERPDILAGIQKALYGRQLLILGGASSAARTSVVKYHPVRNTFAACSAPYFACAGSAAAVHNNKIYVCGGWGNMSHMQTYDIASDTWTLEPTLLRSPRWAGSSIVVNEKMYVTGGRDFRLPQASIEIFDIVNGTCAYHTGQPLPPLKHQRRFHSTVSRNDEIFIVGGYDDDGNDLNLVEVLHTTRFQRYDLLPMHESRSFLAAVVFEDSIVAMGGHGHHRRLSSVERYSFASNRWSYLPSMNVAREGHCACVFDGLIYVVGGRKTNSIEILDNKTMTWTLLGISWEIERCWSTLVEVTDDCQGSEIKRIIPNSVII